MTDYDLPVPTGAEAQPVRWRQLWTTEDWWANWLGLGIILVGFILFVQGASLNWIAVVPGRWSTLAELSADLSANFSRYVAQFACWVVIFSIAIRAFGLKLNEFLPSFCFLYLLSVAVFIVGRWDQAAQYNLEAPLVALGTGLVLSNFVGVPRSFDTGFRVEFYIKTGIVLLGATLPFTLLIWAGPVAIVQAGIVSVITFLVIFFVGRKLGLENRLCAVLGAGGSVCGVTAAIAITGAVGAKKEDSSIAITIVILWAVAMIFFLPLVSRLLGLHAGVAGAWIGTSEFADAAGLAAATTYGSLAENLDSIPGTADQSIFAFTLVKVVGRDIWIGFWAIALALIATTRWEATGPSHKPQFGEVWWRFPKFVLGFFVASLFVTLITSGYTLEEFEREVAPTLVGPIRALRSWAFIFCFLSIGLTTRVRELSSAGSKPFLAFSSGAVVNIALGFILSVYVFGSYWEQLTR
nr:MAG: putative sulfate exporter family transporter [Hyphomicrobiales bacterium]